MTNISPALRIGIFNDSAETISLMKRWFQAHGHVVSTMQASEMRDLSVDGVSFVRTRGCNVVVFDIGIPYASTWDVAEVLQVLIGEPAIPFVFTCANVTELARHIGPTNTFELTGTQANLTELMARVTQAAADRDVR